MTTFKFLTCITQRLRDQILSLVFKKLKVIIKNTCKMWMMRKRKEVKAWSNFEQGCILFQRFWKPSLARFEKSSQNRNGKIISFSFPFPFFAHHTSIFLSCVFFLPFLLFPLLFTSFSTFFPLFLPFFPSPFEKFPLFLNQSFILPLTRACCVQCPSE